MNLNVSFDQSVGSLPSGFVTAVNYVVNYFDNLFTNAVTINVAVGYGEIERQALASNALGESLPGINGQAGYVYLENYAQAAPGDLRPSTGGHARPAAQRDSRSQ